MSAYTNRKKTIYCHECKTHISKNGGECEHIKVQKVIQKIFGKTKIIIKVIYGKIMDIIHE